MADTGALVSKIHHCAVDGVGKRDLLSCCSAPRAALTRTGGGGPTVGPASCPASPIGSPKPPNARALPCVWSSQAVTAAPAAVLKATRDTVTRLADGLERFVEGAESVEAEPAWARVGSPPATPFNAAITAERAWAWLPMPVAASSALRRATGSTLNDVLMAATAGALRDWLAENDALTTDPLIAMVPMSIRGQGHSVGSNQIMLTLCPLPTHLDTPPRTAGLRALGHGPRQGDADLPRC